MSAYWNALEGTIIENKVSKAANNALMIGNPQDVAMQIVERFHPQDRIMAWFDFNFNHNSQRVCRNMTAYMQEVAPLVEKLLEAKMSLNHDKNSVVSPGRPGARLFPDSPLGEDVDGIPSGREVEWVPLVDYREEMV